MDPMTSFVGNFPNFLAYFAVSSAMLAAFVALYSLFTPYHEMGLIRNGNMAACASLGGAILGFTLPLANVVAHSINLVDMAVWGVVAMMVQLAVYLVASRLLSGFQTAIQQNQVSQGAFLGVLSLAVGILNAACMTY